MRFWIVTAATLYAVTAVGQESACPTLSVETPPAIKSYRLDGHKCTETKEGMVEVGQNTHTLTFFGITHCRIFPGMPDYCEVQRAELQSADSDGDCKVAVEWAFVPQKGIVCHTVDR